MSQVQKSFWKCALLVVIATTLAWTSAGAVESQSKGPSDRAPRNILWVTFFEELGQLRNEAEELDKSITKKLAALKENPAKTAREYEKTFMDILKLDHIAEKFTAFVEPAGHDLASRQGQLFDSFMERARIKWGDEKLRRDTIRRIKGVPKAVSAAQKKISKLSRYTKRGNHDKALEEFDEIVDRVYAQALWLRLQKGKRSAAHFMRAKQRPGYVNNAKAQWGGIVLKACGAVIAEWNGRFDALLKDIENAAVTIGEQGQIEMDGKQLHGPAAMNYFGSRWLNIQLASYRARYFAAILRFKDSKIKKAAAIEAAVASFHDRVGPALASIIEKDASRQQADQATARYREYLDVVGPLIAQCTNRDSLIKPLQSALDKLAQSSPDLQANIESYRAVTDDVLRWRHRTVSAQIRTRVGDALSLQDLIRNSSSRPEDQKLLTNLRLGRSGTFPVARVVRDIPSLIDEANNHFLGKHIRIDDVLFNDRQNNMWISSNHRRAIAYIVPKDSLLQFVQARTVFLLQDLFADDDNKPLTLAAHLQYFAAIQNDQSQVGGKVKRIGLIGMHARYTTLHEPDRGLIRLGPFIQEPELIRPVDLIVQFLVEPFWISHSCFLVDVPPSEELAAQN